MELKLHHVNYSTKDVGAVAEFYRSLFNMKPVPSYGDAQITSQGYDRKVEFLTDGTTEFHIAPQDLGVAFRTKQSLNPLDRGHIAFRTNDIEAFKAMLREKNIQFADYGVWAIGGWYQIFLQDPDGTIVEVHQTDYKAPGAYEFSAAIQAPRPFTGVARCIGSLASAIWVNQWRASCSTPGTNSGSMMSARAMRRSSARRGGGPHRRNWRTRDTIIVSLPTLEIFRRALWTRRLAGGNAMKTWSTPARSACLSSVIESGMCSDRRHRHRCSISGGVEALRQARWP